MSVCNLSLEYMYVRLKSYVFLSSLVIIVQTWPSLDYMAVYEMCEDIIKKSN